MCVRVMRVWRGRQRVRPRVGSAKASSAGQSAE